MNRNRIAYLVGVKYVQDEIGQEVPQESKRKIFCDVSSISQTEFFNAGQQNIKADYKLSMFLYDYKDEKIVELNGKRYSVYRTYAYDDTIELYLEEKVGEI